MSIITNYDSRTCEIVAVNIRWLYLWGIVSHFKIEKLWQDKEVC